MSKSAKHGKDTLSVVEFARATGRSLQHVYTHIWMGKLPAKRVGRSWRIAKKELERFTPRSRQPL